MRRHHILIPLAALLAVSPLLVGGCSCGHDVAFHLQSWFDAASQLQHGTLFPRWAMTPAWNAGEPRFIFYPPLSWMSGAVLSLIFPASALPVLYTFLVLMAAGFAMYRLAREFVAPNAALIAAAIYLANPYMLFTAFERAAYAELLGAVWLPLLFLAVLRARPTIHGVSIPLALLWLTNAPAAVMGSYTLALLALFRVVQAMRLRIVATATRGHDNSAAPARLVLTYFFGTLLGLALPAFYLVPAAYERRYVQIAMAVIPNMRIQDNFLFVHTADAEHNGVLYTASMLAVCLLALTMFVTILSMSTRSGQRARPALPTLLLALTFVIALLLTPLSLPLWLHLPEMAFLQFPWRLLAVLATVLGLALALLCNKLRNSPRVRMMSLIGAPLAALALSLFCIHLYRQTCETSDMASAIAEAFHTGHGVLPTDEYTPNDADNDIIRPNDPAYWLTDDPQAFAPATTANPGTADPNFDGTFPADQTLSTPAPHELHIRTAKTTYLVLNLRDYPNWEISENGPSNMAIIPRKIHRNDGLLALYLDKASDYRVHIQWKTTRDQWIGYILTVLALVALFGSLHFTRQTR